MPIRFVEYTDRQTESLRAFNARLRAGGMNMQFPIDVVPSWLPPAAGRRLFQDQYVGVDENAEVRGGYILKHQDFKIGDEIVPIADLRLPISEGAVDRQHTAVATELLFNALAKQRLLFGMGIGGYDEAITKLFEAAGWRIFTIPFFFKVQSPYRFCRKIRFLRRRWHRRAVLDLAAFSGAAWLGFKTLQSIRRHSDPLEATVRVEWVEEFDSWSDELWDRCKSEYGMLAVRDGEVLRLLYPKSDPRFLRLKVSRGDQLIGWAVLLDTQMSDHKQFGDLRVGSFVDGLASIDDVPSVVLAATQHLEKRGVDLIVSNHSHTRWCDGFGSAGYLSGPSNYLFAASRALDKLWRRSDIDNNETFINRGDGDGPINL
jgi:hypothetical protein